MNVTSDATVDKEKQKLSIGVIVRDDGGEVLAALSAPKQHVTYPVVAKATMALQRK